MPSKFRISIAAFAAFISFSSISAQPLTTDYQSHSSHGKTLNHRYTEYPKTIPLKGLSHVDPNFVTMHVILKNKLSHRLTGDQLSQINRKSPGISLHLQGQQKAVVILKSGDLQASLTQLNKNIIEVAGPGAFKEKNGSPINLSETHIASTCMTKA